MSNILNNFSVETQACEICDIICCDVCKSKFVFSQLSITMQNGYWPLYIRDLNQIFLLYSWDSLNSHFDSSIRTLMLERPDDVFNPTAPLKRLRFIRPHLVEYCPNCHKKLEPENWARGPGVLYFLQPKYPEVQKLDGRKRFNLKLPFQR